MCSIHVAELVHNVPSIILGDCDLVETYVFRPTTKHKSKKKVVCYLNMPIFILSM
jgi:hypothetical protein